MFKKLLAAVGIGGAEVETVLHTPGVQPGGVVHGSIRLRSGEIQQHLDGVFVEFVTRVEHETADDRERELMRPVGRVDVQRGVVLEPGQVVEFPFQAQAPFETPITHYKDRPLPGMVVAVRTQLEIKGAFDATDTDPIGIGALPAQHVLLEAVERLGFHLHHADVEMGRFRRTRQQLPFHQEIEFRGSPRYRRINELEVSFLAGPDGMDVVLEADRRPGLLTGERDVANVLHVDYATVHQVDWSAEIHQRLDRIGSGWL
ncbi:sporulation-control protein [Saccharopolyspora kobensis]|uniref:Sporulation-control protein n=1 Tax=Saccharopolyspora kobensis TaxID=146035 RepID=A0A1H6E7J8_9PSEU|nr:sporulation protein [Saccharopolyspora kobensis]SEG93119.1 sporulation-control protein [Saccharopolyspora kobensis]SFD42867.1 sporulation-control protein [Saccharopolyspora kobensis]